MKRETLATGGLLGVSVLIASCCIGPTLVLLFGVSISALGTLSVLEPFRPMLIAVGGGLLAYAGLRIYRRPAALGPDPCPDDACAPGPASRRLPRWLLGGAIVCYTVATLYPYVLEALL